MLSRESNVRISIVVPHLGDVVAFEESLVSVLENRPAGAEVWVAHDGTYQDPFDLGDEVRFVIARSGTAAALVAAAAEVVTSRVMHVIGGGVRATHEWTRSALECMQDDAVAVVAPVARRSIGQPITAAGWSDSPLDILSPLGRGLIAINRRQAAKVRGAYLMASFWATGPLRSVCRAFALDDTTAAQYAWSRLLTDNGWRCELAGDSVVLADDQALFTPPSFHRGQTLRSLSSEIDQRARYGAVASAIAANLCVPTRLLSAGRWLDTIGQVAGLLRETAAVRSIRYDLIDTPEDQSATLPLVRPNVQPMPLRRAA